MSDRMIPTAFEPLLMNVIDEMDTKRSALYVPSVSPRICSFPFCGGILDNPTGPAAGPHTQLAGNLIAAYVAGGRIFELKTVQVIDGDDLPVKKPCIYVEGEAYNVEWSTELTVAQAAEEYIKAWIIIKLLAEEYELGSPDGFQFHMSVGYDLEGICSPKVDTFIEIMKNAALSPVWEDCISTVKRRLSSFSKVNAAYVDAISPRICNTVTLSTLHGCPVEDIKEMIAYMLKEKGLHTFIKCNPTLAGYETARKILDEKGYGYLHFDKEQFDHDLQPDYAVKMLGELKTLAESLDLVLGVKLTNTFPVAVRNQELPGEIMYLSGKPLFLLAIRAASLLADAFSGELPISFSGGIDSHNINDTLAAGIAPVTVATLLLKQGGYKNLSRLTALTPDTIPEKADGKAIHALADSTLSDPYYQKEKVRPRQPGTLEEYACYRCRNCVDVCPNRANRPLEDIKKCIHIDDLCNECGSCLCLCPFGYRPYQDKFTLFSGPKAMEESSNNGFFITEQGFTARIGGTIIRESSQLPAELQPIIESLMP